MINQNLGFSDETQALIERQCRNVEREDFVLNKKQAAECILKTYDLFDLKRPSKVVWGDDIFASAYQKSAWLASSAWSASSASSASSAWLASSASSDSSAWLASSARFFLDVNPLALDSDLEKYIFVYEYFQNPSSDKPNENDRIYLDYCELLMQAKERGVGYRFEHEDTLYIVPTPIVKIDANKRFHSEDGPAIRWKNGWQGYYLYGENFGRELWERIVSGNFTAKELMTIEDTDKRSIAMTYLVPEDMLKEMHATLIHTGVKGNQLYQCKNYLGSGKTEYALLMTDASTPRQFIHFVPKDFDFHNNADEATAGMFRDVQGNRMPVEDYLNIEIEA